MKATVNFRMHRYFQTFSYFSRWKNSHDWLERQRKDIYIEKAKKENYRCRSAFKLLEINDRYKLFKPGQFVVDLGAAPGSWTQVIVNKINSNSVDSKPVGKVIAIDKLPIFAIDGAIILSGTDFTSSSTQSRIFELLGSGKLDVVVSDMAPNASGIKALDQENIYNLAIAALRFSVTTLKIGGSCLIKIWDGGGTKTIEMEMSRFFENTKMVKPLATRSDSSEVYLLARYFKGLKT